MTYYAYKSIIYTQFTHNLHAMDLWCPRRPTNITYCSGGTQLNDTTGVDHSMHSSSKIGSSSGDLASTAATTKHTVRVLTHDCTSTVHVLVRIDCTAPHRLHHVSDRPLIRWLEVTDLRCVCARLSLCTDVWVCHKTISSDPFCSRVNCWSPLT